MTTVVALESVLLLPLLLIGDAFQCLKTCPAGRDELARAGAAKLDSVQIHALDASGGTIAPLAILRLLHLQFGVRILLHEGGPTLFGQFLATEAVDELFMTLSPQIAGRKADAIGPALVRHTLR